MGNRRFTTVERLEEIARNALLGGYGTLQVWRDGKQAPRRLLRLNLSMDCTEPYGFELHARVSAWHGRKVMPMTVYGETRCRKCDACKKRRSRFWTAKAMTEFGHWPRSIFGTFTLSPDEHYELRAEATSRLADKAVSFSSLPESEKLRELTKQFGVRLTKWFKLIRQARDRDAAFRYLMVAEVHQGNPDSQVYGKPHFHILLHEKHPGALVLGDPFEAISSGQDGEWERKYEKNRRANKWEPVARVQDSGFIRKNWTTGFTRFQWAATAQSAVYLCKYLNKADISPRVRASLHYGDVERFTSQTPPKRSEVERAVVTRSVKD